ncbi:Sensor histidine kinase ResE [Candidatus Thermoflexus japonica]|uniref:histidine kinase n=1 Tax=Candidatus Thermoflexus japonica TaxID=2035417 RepID=A0A2H5Y669_9CHLR|nr:Sensor histidine kinase ResE [Candidatus Thermoflexus japonica]
MRHAVRIVVTVIPLLLSLLLSVLLARGLLPNRVLVGTFVVDAAALAVGIGGFVSLTLGIGWAWHTWLHRRITAAETTARAAQVAAHRRFLRRLDHELKNPLAILRVGLANLQRRAVWPPEEAERLARLAEQVGRLEAFVTGLRWLTELEDTIVERTRVDLQAVLEEALTLVCGEAGEQGRKVDMHIQQIPWSVGPVLGDHELLVVVFRNVLDNAMKFTRAGDRVEVRVMEDGDWAVVEVADTGLGIPADELPHIFEELYRGRNAREVPGSGLGLALVERIVTLHGGKVAVRSREGQGTVVRVWLPLAKEK